MSELANRVARWSAGAKREPSKDAAAQPQRLAAGFYSKTFMWPPSFWEKIYEPAIRRAAGLGRVAPAPDPDRYERAFAFCDVLVIGAGPAGLMAALAAARAGARVILCDQDFEVGGRLIAERREVGGQSAADFARARVAELAAM